MKKQASQRPLSWLWRHSRSKLFLVILLVLCNILTAASSVVFALLVRDVIDGATAAASGAPLTMLIQSAIWLALLILLQIFLRFPTKYFAEKLTASLEMSYRLSLFSSMLKKDFGGISAYHSGELLNRLFSDAMLAASGAAEILPTIAATVTRLVCAVGVMAFLEWRFTLIFFVVGFLILESSRLFRNQFKLLHKKMQSAEGKTRSFMQEVLSSLLVVKVFDAEDLSARKVDALQKAHFGLRMKRVLIGVYANIGYAFVFKVGYFGALVWCALSITGAFPALPAAMTYGTLMAILQLVNQIQTPFSSLSGILPRYYSMTASVERMMEIESLPDAPVEESVYPNATEFYREFQSIRFRDITFRYEDENVLEHANAEIEKGDFCVITGLSGIGKSTLLKLLLGVYHQNEGEIRFATARGELSPMSAAQRVFAYVPQGNMLFSGTIRENISFIKEDATEEEILSAARVACVTDFLDELPQGLDTLIGEHGFGLSEGQVQRVAIARALLSGAPILLLDESTSALDEDTERRMLHELTLLREKTCIIVSHKKAAFDICNKEIVLQNKSVVVRELNHAAL